MPSGDLLAFTGTALKITAPTWWLGRAFASWATRQLVLEQLGHMLELAHTFPTWVLSSASLRNNIPVVFLPLCQFIGPVFAAAFKCFLSPWQVVGDCCISPQPSKQ